MPFYEYECDNCKFYTEVLQKVSDAPLRKCPSCGKNALKKLVSAPVFRLKGSGWYETDFKSDKEGKRNLAADKEPEAKESKVEAKPAEPKATEAKSADSKSDSKSDSKPADSKAEAKVSEPKASETKSSSTAKHGSRKGAMPHRPAASAARARGKAKATPRGKRR
jgi:putative FmdB family regulatory protein